MKNIYFLFLLNLILLSCSSVGHESKTSTSLKVYTFESIDSLVDISSKKIAVFIHTDWCKYCKNMQLTTLKNQSVVKLLNEEFFFISLDGEQKEMIIFNDHKFEFKPTSRHLGTHELASQLGSINNQLTYPVFVILNDQYEIIFQQSSYLDAQAMIAILENS